jgi:hypothetical protein
MMLLGMGLAVALGLLSGILLDGVVPGLIIGIAGTVLTFLVVLAAKAIRPSGQAPAPPAGKQRNLAYGIVLGIALGAAMGAALGNMAFIGVGLAMGVAIGIAIDERR